MKKITKNNVSDHVDDLIDLAEKIKPGKITILTGSNGSGKSFVRKMLGIKMPTLNDGLKVASISMEKRAGLNMDGAMGAFTHDTDWNPTSIETFKYINGLLSQKDRYLVIDEPEIGMGEETVLGLVYSLNKKLIELSKKKDFKGILFITHSRIIVENLKHNTFLNVDGLTQNQWLNRKLLAIDQEELDEKSIMIFREIQDRINSNKS